MESYEKTYPSGPVKVILAGTGEEMKRIGLFLAEYAALTKKTKSVERYRERFAEAAEQDVPLVLLNQEEARQLYLYVEKYSELKKKTKNHRIHKLLRFFEDALNIW